MKKDYVSWLKDKICYIRIEGTQFGGGVKVNLDLKLSVEDSPNCAGVAVYAIRCCKLALDRGIAGALPSVAASTMKHPLVQYTDEEAHILQERFIKGEVKK